MSNNAASVASSSRLDLLRKKKEELSSIAKGHKRKLREYLITSKCDPSSHPLPILSTTLSQDEQKLLDDADITKGRRFDESSIPSRRQLRSQTSKLEEPISTTPQSLVTPSVYSKLPFDAKSQNLPQHATEVSDENAQQDVQVEDHSKFIGPNGIQQGSDPDDRMTSGLGRRSSRGSQTTPIVDENGTDTLMDDVPADGPSADANIPSNLVSKTSDQNGMRPAVESRRRSPTKISIPIPTDGKRTTDLPVTEPVSASLKKSEGSNQNGTDSGLGNVSTREEQKEEASLNMSLQIPKTIADAVSSPESTSGALSATTPAFHEASTDTSPDNEALQYDANQHSRKSPEVHSPSIPTRHDEEKVAVANERSVEPTIDARPSSADVQLQLDAEQAAASAKLQAAQTPESILTNDKAEAVREGNADEDEVMGLPTPQDKTSPNALPTPVSGLDKAREIPDSQETRSSDQLLDQSVAPSKTSVESRNAPEKQSKVPKEPSPVTASSTPRRPPSTAPPIERMTTRVSSGAIRNRSVSEIIGEKENQTTSSPSELNTRKGSESQSSKSTSRASTPQTSLMKSMVEKAKEKERSKLSTVIFAKQPAKKLPEDFASLPSGAKQQSPKSDDYLKLHLEVQISERLKHTSLSALIQAAHKTLNTADSSLPIEQTQMDRLIMRVQRLQHEQKWSLRQPKRSIEPSRPTTHRDLMMQEMKWMRTDFREERKWKMAVARNLARDCALYHESSNNPAEQALLKVKLRQPSRPWSETELANRRDCYPNIHFEVSQNDMDMVDAPDHLDQSTPDLIPSGEESSPPEVFDEEIIDVRDTTAPTAIFTLADDDVVFRLTNSPTSEKLLNELPMYGAPLQVPQSLLPTSEHSPDAHWKRPILPLSKYTEGQMIIVDPGPPRKKSRYDYETDDEDELEVFDERQSRTLLPPEATNVALFNPENKHIRDRIHASHQFRPPSEFPMPMQSFFENREYSQWTNEEDDELRRKVREYAYNWSFIASDLQRGTARSCSLFTTPSERRTPWECFERWVQLEGLPQDMSKTSYFRAYMARVHSAERNLAQHQAPQQQPNGAAGASASLRRPRRSATCQSTERRRNMKHLYLVDSMRKNAKKKEAAQAKQLQATAVQQQRKQNEQAQGQAQARALPRQEFTPQAFSKIKHDRDVAQRERIERFQQQQAAARQLALQQGRQAQQNPQLTAAQQQALLQQQHQQQQQQQQRAPNGVNPPNSQNLAVPGQNRNPMQHPGNGLPMPLPNSNGLIPPPVNIPQAQMLRAAVMQPNVPSPAQLMQARQLSDQQRMIAAQQQQQHAQNPGANGNSNVNQNSPPNMRGGAMGVGMNMNMNQVGGNPAMRQNFMGFSNNGGLSSPSASVGLPPPGLQQGSPRMGRQVMTQTQQQLFSRLQHDLRANNPAATDQQINQLMQDTIARRQHNAMQAAAGGSGSPISGFNAGSPGSMPNPMSNSGNPNGNGESNDSNSNSMGNVGMMRGSLGNASGMQPQTYANMLRQHQMQQQLQIQQQQQGQGGGHMRNGSLSAQNQFAGQNGQAQNQQGMGNGNAQHSNGIK